MAGQVVSIDTQISSPVADRKPRKHPVEVYLNRLAPSSRRGMLIALNNLARTIFNGQAGASELDWAELRYEDTTKLRKAMAERFTTRTANYHLCGLRGVFKECWRLNLMSHADYARAVDLKQLRGKDNTSGRALTHEELVKLFRACDADPSPAGLRDAAILGVLYGTGLRRSELTALRVADYSGGVLTVHGKGNTTRLAYVVGQAQGHLERWLELRGQAEGPLFVAINKARRLGSGRLIGESVARILNRRAVEAGVERFSPHDVRRTTATHLLENGVDLNTVKGILGHANISTTILYDRRGEQAKQKAAELLGCAPLA